MLRIVSLLVCLAIFACGNPTDSAPAASAKTVALQTSIPPVYEDFADLAPLFERHTDSVYVINFWATWCKPCVEELPYFEQLHETFKGEKLSVTLVSLDFPNQLESHLVPFLEKEQPSSDVVVLTDGKYNDWIAKVDESWTGAIPVTLIYNAKKREFVGRQFKSFEEIKILVSEFL